MLIDKTFRYGCLAIGCSLFAFLVSLFDQMKMFANLLAFKLAEKDNCLRRCLVNLGISC